MQFKIGNFNVSFDGDAPNLHPRKQAILKTLIEHGQVSTASMYLESFRKFVTFFNTRTIQNARRDLSDQRIDRLANRTRAYWDTRMLDYYNPNSETGKSPVPGRYEGLYLGIEIECILPEGMDYNTVINRMIKNKIKGVTLSDDGSIEHGGCGGDNDDCSDGYCHGYCGNEWGIEFRVLTRIDDMSNLQKLCEMLEAMGAYVNTTCGLHVHLDYRHTKFLGMHARARRLLKALPILKGMVPESRRDNHYCREGISEGGDRYYMLNTSSFKKHKTLEVRLHSGTVNYLKISSWAKLLWTIANTKYTGEINNLGDIVTAYKLDSELSTYIKQRILKFNKAEVARALIGDFALDSELTIEEEISEEIAA